MTNRLLLAAAVVLALSSCTITQTANPVIGLRDSAVEICVVEKPDVRADFQDELLAALERRGLSSRVLPAGSPVTACPVSLTYNAKWSWDFVLYMAWAEIVVYRDGTRVGDALYSAPRAGWSMTTRIYEPTESKVDTMVEELFPAN